MMHPSHRRRRGIGWFMLVALLALAGGGWWWWRMPHACRLVSYARCSFEIFAPTLAGVLVHETRENGKTPADYFVMRSWRDGTVRWQVRAAQFHCFSSDFPSTKPWIGYSWNANIRQPCPWSVSPNGRVLAQVAPERTLWRVRTWRDGKLIGAVALPATGSNPFTDPRFHVRATDSGRVIAYSYNYQAKAGPAYCLDGARILARGKLLDGLDTTIAPDGSLVAVGVPSTTRIRYAAITIAAQRIILGPPVTTDPGVDDGDLLICTGGMLFAGTGAVYDKTGRLRPPVNPSGLNHSRLTPAHGVVAYLQGTRCVIETLTRGRRWSFPTPPHTEYILVNEGGDHLAFFQDNPYPPAIRLLGERYFPAIYNRLRRATYGLAIYQRPGVLKARIAFGPDVTLRVAGQAMHLGNGDYALSPDGHSVAFSVTDDSGHYSLAMYRY